MIALLFDLVLLSCSLLVFFVVGTFLLSSHLFEQSSLVQSRPIRPLRHRQFSLSEWLFAYTFSLSLQLFFLLLMEILGLMEHMALLIFWRLTLFLLIALLVAVIPLHFIRRVVLGVGLLGVSVRRSTFYFFSFGLYFVAIFLLGCFLPILADRHYGFLTLDYWCSRILLAGVALMAVLSGLASVEYIIRVLYGDRDRMVGESAKINVIKRATLCEEGDVVLTEKNPRELSGHCLLNQHDVDHGLDRNFAPESKGPYKDALFWLGSHFNKLMAVYSVYKITLALVNLFVYKMASGDPTTFISGAVLHLFGLEMNAKRWSALFSLWTIGVLVFSSLRGFLNSLMRHLLRIVPFDSAEASILMISYLTGIYFMSTVVTLQTGQSDAEAFVVSSILPHLQFGFFSTWFDLVFVSTVAFALLHFGLRR